MAGIFGDSFFFLVFVSEETKHENSSKNSEKFGAKFGKIRSKIRGKIQDENRKIRGTFVVQLF